MNRVGMLEQTILAGLRALPQEKQQEVLDFVEFLRQRALVPSSQQSSDALETLEDNKAYPLRGLQPYHYDAPFEPATALTDWEALV